MYMMYDDFDDRARVLKPELPYDTMPCAKELAELLREHFSYPVVSIGARGAVGYHASLYQLWSEQVRSIFISKKIVTLTGEGVWSTLDKIDSWHSSHTVANRGRLSDMIVEAWNLRRLTTCSPKWSKDLDVYFAARGMPSTLGFMSDVVDPDAEVSRTREVAMPSYDVVEELVRQKEVEERLAHLKYLDNTRQSLPPRV